MGKQLTKPCAICGKPVYYYPSQHQRSTCSPECYAQFRKGKVYVSITRNCDRCGKEYTTKTGRSMFCSVECRELSYQLPLQKTCVICGNAYRCSNARGKRSKYCSPACRDKAKNLRALIDKTCQICGTVFKEVPSGRRKGGGIYCSKTCSIEGMRRAKDKGGHVNKYGYRVLRRDRTSILEHRYVMQQMLGREMYDFENVHHKNGERSDNRPENLELWVTPQRPGQRLQDVIDWMLQFLSKYGEVTFKQTDPYVPQRGDLNAGS